MPKRMFFFDQESWDIWKELISEDQIILGNKKDNFWEMQIKVLCVHVLKMLIYELKKKKALVSGKILVNADHPQVVEIWNNVFYGI
jgi:alanyl-tRNA synthetase